MASKPALCCPPPTVRSPLHPHEIPASPNSVTAAEIATMKRCSPEGDALVVQMDASTIPPKIIGAMYMDGSKYEGDLTALVDCEATLTGTDCEGEAAPLTGKEGQIVQVVQAPGQVLSVRFCDDMASRDWELVKRCHPDTGAEILFQWDVRTNPPTLVSATDLTTGLPFTGDANALIACGSTSASVQTNEVCYNGQTLTQWVVTEDGIPTGVVYYTDVSGAIVEDVDPTQLTSGKCEASCAKAPLGVVTSWAV